jgi:hypothetical protein
MASEPKRNNRMVEERADAILRMLRASLIELLQTMPHDGCQITINVAAGGTKGHFDIRRKVNFQVSD